MFVLEGSSQNNTTKARATENDALVSLECCFRSFRVVVCIVNTKYYVLVVFEGAGRNGVVIKRLVAEHHGPSEQQTVWVP